MPVTLGNTSITSSSGTLNVVDTLHVHNSSETGYATNAATSLSRATLSLRPHATDSPRILFGSLDTSVNNAIAGSAYIQRGNGTSAWDLHLQPFGGRVLMPNQPASSAHLSTSQNVVSNTWTKVNLNTTRFNIGNHFNTTNNRFTAPVSGKYLTAYTVHFEGSNSGIGTYLYSSIYINGSNQHFGEGRRHVNGWMADNTLSTAQLFQLSAGDYIELYAYSEGANILGSGGSRGHLGVYFLG